MARKARIEYEGAIYHVMARGNERARIFHAGKDYELLLKALEEALERFGVELHVYFLMPNHFHLAVRTPEGNLSRFMAWLQTTFTVRYNRKYRRSGHLFQGRYRAELVEDTVYGKWLALYIHLNPVRQRKNGEAAYLEGGFEKVNRFRWSSHRAWIGAEKSAIKGLRQDWLVEWGRVPAVARENYLKNIQKEIIDATGLDWKTKVQMGWLAGSEAFREKMGEMLRGRKREMGGEESARMVKSHRHGALKQKLDQEKDKRVKIWMRVRLLGESQVALAREYGYGNSSGIYQTVRRLEERSKENAALCQKMAALKKCIM